MASSRPTPCPLETERPRHVAVALLELAVGLVVAVGTSQQDTQPQKPDLAQRKILIAGGCHQPVDGISGFGDVTFGGAKA